MSDMSPLKGPWYGDLTSEKRGANYPRRIWFGLMAFTILFTVSCAGIGSGKGTVGISPSTEIGEICRRVFPPGRWQFVHAMEVRFRGGKSGQFLGITSTDSGSRHLECALLTIEGLVLFEAGKNEKLSIRRSVPPFDSVAFAQGLMDDVSFIFYPPQGRLVKTKRLGGTLFCRYRSQEDDVTDIIVKADGSWELARRGGRSERSVEANHCEASQANTGVDIPCRLLLKAAGTAGYSITLRLLSAEPMDVERKIREQEP